MKVFERVIRVGDVLVSFPDQKIWHVEEVCKIAGFSGIRYKFYGAEDNIHMTFHVSDSRELIGQGFFHQDVLEKMGLLDLEVLITGEDDEN